MTTKTKILFLIIIIAAILRVIGIAWGLPSKDYYFSYNSDEVNYIRGLSQMDPARFDFNPHYFNWGSWHYYELGAAIGLASFLNIVELNKDKNFYYSHPWVMAKIYLIGRLLSVLFALATVILVYLIGKKIYGVREGLLAALFMAINPAHIVHSHYLKADTSVTFWLTVLLLTAIYLLETGKLRWYILGGVFSAIAVGSQLNGIWFIHTIFFAHLLHKYRVSGRLNSFQNVFISKNLLIGYLSVLVVYLIINPSLYLSTAEFITGIRNVIFRQGGGIDTVGRVNLVINTVRAFGISLTPFFIVLGLSAVIYGVLSRSKTNLLLLIWLAPYLPFIIGWRALNTRHQMLIFPGVFVLSSGFIFFLYAKIRKKILRIILTGGVVLFCLYAAFYSYIYDKGLSGKTVQAEASEWLVLNVVPKSRIGILNNPEVRHYPTIIHQDYYYKENARYVIVNLNSSIDNLRAEQPEYLIFNRKVVFAGKQDSYSRSLINYIENNYKLIKSIERRRFFLFFNFEPVFSTPDWEMPFPAIYILKKTM